MNERATEVDPDYFVRVRLPKPLSTHQVAVLRRVGPGLAQRSPGQFLNECRGAEEVTLGPYLRRYQAEGAKSELIEAKFAMVELLAK